MYVHITSFLQDYPKLSQTYYVLLECLAQDHMAFLATMEPQVFLYILSSISEGLTALGGNLNYFTGTRAGPSRRQRLNRMRNWLSFLGFLCSYVICTGGFFNPKVSFILPVSFSFVH